MKSVAQLKRDAQSGQFSAQMLIRCGTDNIPPRLQGYRKIVGCNSVSLFFQCQDGNVSELALPRASLIEYDGDTLTTYYAGYRDLTAEEKKVMQGWKEKASTPEFRAQAEADAMTDGSSTYWAEVAYFSKAGYKYLMGTEKERGMRWDWNKEQIQDERIKGAVCMKYEIRRVS